MGMVIDSFRNRSLPKLYSSSPEESVSVMVDIAKSHNAQLIRPTVDSHSHSAPRTEADVMPVATSGRGI
jgi:hypothetical protein